MVGVGRDLWGHPAQPLPKQGHPEPAAQDLVQVGLEYLQRRRLHSPSGQPWPGLPLPSSTQEASTHRPAVFCLQTAQHQGTEPGLTLTRPSTSPCLQLGL